MYLAKLHLRNWRSYADTTFEFDSQTEKKPIILIGAMNGHGKTSFLVSLYLGLFGKYGLRHCEGFAHTGNSDFRHYRGAIQQYRRNQADPDDPSVIDITFKTSIKDDSECEVRVVRRWFFTGKNTPKQGENFEQVEVYVDGRLQGRQDAHDQRLEKSHGRIERNLFPAHVAPAFFFDGEQAQKLIENMGEAGLRKAVEVMYGTRIISEASDRVRRYLTALRNKAGGKGKLTDQEKALNDKISKRDEINKRIAALKNNLSEYEKEKDKRDSDRTELRNELARLGGDIGAIAAKIHTDFARAQRDEEEAANDISIRMSGIGLALALTRMGGIVTSRLDSEESRESWEGLKRGTLDSKERVLEVAMPEPPEKDSLLGNLSAEIRSEVRTRFGNALDQIYNPPPKNCSSEYLLGHIKGESRNHVRQAMLGVQTADAQTLKNAVRRLRDARESMQDADRKKKRLEGQPDEVSQLNQQIGKLDQEIGNLIQNIGSAVKEITTLDSDLHNLNAEIGKLQDALARLGPDQQRMAVAERLAQAFDELQEHLRPKTMERMEKQVTTHFLKIADERFKSGKIKFPEKTEPFVELPSGPQSVETMSGFEKRTFGIAFSLALADIIQRRIPLIIDTPIGNADSEYRLRTLKAWSSFDSDQIIILTHNKEVDLELAGAIESAISQKFLVKYRGQMLGSRVEPDQYFKS